jgi:hypothetical protein
MERTYGLGLTGLIHPVTGEFNHANVIKQRGGRYTDEEWGTVHSLGISYALGSIHSLWTGDHTLMARWRSIGDTKIDSYDSASFLYGWIVAL